MYNNNNKTWLAVLASRFDMSFVQVWFIASLGSILDSQLSCLVSPSVALLAELVFCFCGAQLKI